MAVLTIKEEQDVIKAVLAFANLQRISSARQVENIFARLPQVPGYFKTIVAPEKTTAAEDVATYAHWQQEVRDRLRRIIKPSERRNVTAEISAALAEKVRMHYALNMTSRGPVLMPGYVIDDVEAACAFGIALILDAAHNITSRLQQCPAPDCGKFRLDLIAKGRPGRFCKREHKVAFEIAEAKRKRDAEKLEDAKKLVAQHKQR